MSSPKPAGRCPGSASKSSTSSRARAARSRFWTCSRSLAAGRLSFHVWTERRRRLQELLVLGRQLQRRGAASGGARRDARRRLARSAEQARCVQKRLGWSFKWLSSGKNEFNFDLGVAFREEDRAAATMTYNYAPLAKGPSDLHGISVFFKDASGAIFHTYSTYGAASTC